MRNALICRVAIAGVRPLHGIRKTLAAAPSWSRLSVSWSRSPKSPLKLSSASESAKSWYDFFKLFVNKLDPTIVLDVNQNIVGNFAFLEHA